LTGQAKLEAKWQLRNYVNYYLIDKSSMGFLAWPLPGLLPDGTPTDEKYSVRMQTLVDFTNPNDAKYLTVEWDPADPMVMTLVAMNGDRIQTTRRSYQGQRIMPDVCADQCVYVLDDCFNYRTMFGN
jgi:hypothetical protein